jgi:hypothetical protein
MYLKAGVYIGFTLMASGIVITNVIREVTVYNSKKYGRPVELSNEFVNVAYFFRISRFLVDQVPFIAYLLFVRFYLTRKLEIMKENLQKFSKVQKCRIFWAIFLAILNDSRTLFTVVIGFYVTEDSYSESLSTIIYDYWRFIIGPSVEFLNGLSILYLFHSIFSMQARIQKR